MMMSAAAVEIFASNRDRRHIPSNDERKLRAPQNGNDADSGLAQNDTIENPRVSESEENASMVMLWSGA